MSNNHHSLSPCVPPAVSPRPFPPRTPDRALLRRWVDGDLRAGNCLIARYQDRLYRHFTRQAPTQEPAELTQETLMQLCVSAASALHSKNSFRAYLFGIARNVLNQQLRRIYQRRERDSQLQVHELANEQTPATTLAVVRERAELFEELAQLPREQRALLHDFYWNDRTAEQLGGELGVPAGTVRTRLHYSKRRLSKALEGGRISEGELDTQVQLLRSLMCQGPCGLEAR